jgi:hypothetical protein
MDVLNSHPIPALIDGKPFQTQERGALLREFRHPSLL